jgi:hypothetical protein
VTTTAIIDPRTATAAASTANRDRTDTTPALLTDADADAQYAALDNEVAPINRTTNNNRTTAVAGSVVYDGGGGGTGIDATYAEAMYADADATAPPAATTDVYSAVAGNRASRALQSHPAAAATAAAVAATRVDEENHYDMTPPGQRAPARRATVDEENHYDMTPPGQRAPARRLTTTDPHTATAAAASGAGFARKTSVYSGFGADEGAGEGGAPADDGYAPIAEGTDGGGEGGEMMRRKSSVYLGFSGQSEDV